MAPRAFITVWRDLNYRADERAFVREAQPWALIIFKRNVSTPTQLTELIQSFRDTVGWEAPVLIDQEGGRVQRLARRIGRSIRPARSTAPSTIARKRWAWRAAQFAGHLIAADLKAVGIDVDACLRGGRAGSRRRPDHRRPRLWHRAGKVAALAGAIAKGLLAGGVLPVLKHLPGHGRAGGRQPSQAAGGRYRPGDLGTH
ncbi:MAG: glycoside hydrolase family 3 N-terminal domain-containing protein [Pseudolabrys sp.]